MTIPNLAPHQVEALALLSEELGEAQQVIGKILRHGFDSTHPDGGPDNRALLEKELGDIRAAMEIMADLGYLNLFNVSTAADSKLARVGRFLHRIAIDDQTRRAYVCAAADEAEAKPS